VIDKALQHPFPAICRARFGGLITRDVFVLKGDLGVLLLFSFSSFDYAGRKDTIKE
jgi:hypothetical protein